MVKDLTKILIVIIAIGAVGFAYYYGSNKNKEEIQRAKLEMQELKSQRDSIKTVVAYKDSVQKYLNQEIADLTTEADSLRSQVGQIETKRQTDQLNVRKLNTQDQLEAKIIKTFPEISHTQLLVTEVYNKAADLSIQYISFPLWFSETFIIDHQNSIAYEQQKNKLVQVDDLQQNVITLKDSVLTLEKEKTAAYKKGYDDAYTKYEDLNKKYIEELNKPTFSLPNWIGVAGGAAAGFLIGRGTK